VRVCDPPSFQYGVTGRWGRLKLTTGQALDVKAPARFDELAAAVAGPAIELGGILTGSVHVSLISLIIS
jgi:hypothetical protein